MWMIIMIIIKLEIIFFYVYFQLDKYWNVIFLYITFVKIDAIFFVQASFIFVFK